MHLLSNFPLKETTVISRVGTFDWGTILSRTFLDLHRGRLRKAVNIQKTGFC